MFSRSHILSAAAAVVLAGSAWGQAQPPSQTPPPGGSGQTPPDTLGSPMGAPRSNTAGNPGAVPQDAQMDPYMADKEFVKGATESSATEVQLGKLAQEKASSDAVKELGKQMVEAHTQTAQQLKKLPMR